MIIDHQSNDCRDMEDWPLTSVTKKLLEAASIVQNYDLLRLQVSAPLFLFLHRLARQCDHSAKQLGRFLALISATELAEEITRDLSPAEFKEFRTQIDRLRREQGVAIDKKDWKQAAAMSHQVASLKERVRQAYPAIDIQADHFLQAIARLGYDQPITV